MLLTKMMFRPVHGYTASIWALPVPAVALQCIATWPQRSRCSWAGASAHGLIVGLQVAAITGRVLALQAMLGSREGLDLVWMLEREPR